MSQTCRVAKAPGCSHAILLAQHVNQADLHQELPNQTVPSSMSSCLGSESKSRAAERFQAVRAWDSCTSIKGSILYLHRCEAGGRGRRALPALRVDHLSEQVKAIGRHSLGAGVHALPERRRGLQQLGRHQRPLAAVACMCHRSHESSCMRLPLCEDEGQGNGSRSTAFWCLDCCD